MRIIFYTFVAAKPRVSPRPRPSPDPHPSLISPSAPLATPMAVPASRLAHLLASDHDPAALAQWTSADKARLENFVSDAAFPVAHAIDQALVDLVRLPRPFLMLIRTIYD